MRYDGQKGEGARTQPHTTMDDRTVLVGGSLKHATAAAILFTFEEYYASQLDARI